MEGHPDSKMFSFNDFVKLLEKQTVADLEPYEDFLDELAKLANINRHAED